jgi:hypothetical protein
VEENKPTTSENEDVEAHGYTERPVGEQPSAEANSEEPDVQGHSFTERPAQEDREGFSERPVGE